MHKSITNALNKRYQPTEVTMIQTPSSYFTDALLEISRLNRAAGETVFNPAAREFIIEGQAQFENVVTALKAIIADAHDGEAGSFTEHGHIRDGVAASLIENAIDVLDKIEKG